MLHRWMGGVAALFLVVLSVTGLMLNYSESLGLNEMYVRSSWVLSRYGMKTGREIRSYRVSSETVLSEFENTLYLNHSKIVPIYEKPIGIVVGNFVVVVVTPKEVVQMTVEGELIEKIDLESVGVDRVIQVGRGDNGESVLQTENTLFVADEDWITFTPYKGMFGIERLESIPTPPAIASQIIRQFQGQGVSFYRVILDVHSGRFFGVSGKYVMDITAICILFLVFSGLVGWFWKSRRPPNGGTDR